MTEIKNKLSRRDFLKFAGRTLVGFSVLSLGGNQVEAPVTTDTSLPHFDKNSNVLVSPSGKVAFIDKENNTTKWMDPFPGKTIETDNGGGVSIIYEYKGKKPIGLRGFAYSNVNFETGGDLVTGWLVPSVGVLPSFDDNSEVVVLENGKVAIRNDGQIVTEWMNPNQTILTDDGELNIISHSSNSKSAGPLTAFSYSDNDPSNGHVDRMGFLTYRQ